MSISNHVQVFARSHWHDWLNCDLTAILNDCLRVPFDAKTQQSLTIWVVELRSSWRLFPMTRKLVLPTLLEVFSGNRSGVYLRFVSLIVMDPFGILWVSDRLELNIEKPTPWTTFCAMHCWPWLSVVSACDEIRSRFEGSCEGRLSKDSCICYGSSGSITMVVVLDCIDADWIVFACKRNYPNCIYMALLPC